MPLDGFAVNHKASGSLDMRFLTTKRGNFHASKCPKGDDFRGTLIEQALHLAKAPPFTDISIKMKALSVNRLLKKCRLRTNGPKIRLCP